MAFGVVVKPGRRTEPNVNRKPVLTASFHWTQTNRNLYDLIDVNLNNLNLNPRLSKFLEP